jgi:two-component system phosphate regulon response regulator OmpR
MDDAAHLLVVDDDTRTRELLRRFLAERGYRVATAADAKEAEAQLEAIAFDLVVLDVMLPGEDGIAFTRRLRAAKRDVPVVLLTARGETADRITGLSAGADDYLPKPFEPADEGSLLRVLAAAANAPVSREELLRRSRLSGNVRTVDVTVTRLRPKLEDDPRNPRFLQTVRGAGYLLRTD